MIYQLSWESGLAFAEAGDYALLKTWKQPAPMTDWTPITVTPKADTERQDIMGLHNIMVWSHVVLDGVASIVDDAIQALPVYLDGTTHYAIHVTCALDCLDAAQSQFRRFKNRNIGVEDYVLRSDCVANAALFTVPDDGYSAVFVSDAVKSMVEDMGWTWVSFSDVALS